VATSTSIKVEKKRRRKREDVEKAIQLYNVCALFSSHWILSFIAEHPVKKREREK